MGKSMDPNMLTDVSSFVSLTTGTGALFSPLKYLHTPAAALLKNAIDNGGLTL